MFVTNWISTTKIQKISEITNFFRHYFLSRTEVVSTAEHATASVIIASTGNAVENGNVKQPTKRMNFKIMHLWAITSNKA